MIKAFCDKCSAEITGQGEYEVDFDDFFEPPKGVNLNMDLCKSCYNKLKGIIVEFARK